MASIEVLGVKQVLRDLKTIDSEARKQFAKDAKQIAAPIVVAAQGRYPAHVLSGMKYRWTQNGRQLLPWDQRKARRGITVKVDAGKRSDGVVTVIQKDPAASIIEFAADSRLGRSLSTLAWGAPARVMWPAAETHVTDVQNEMTKAIDEVAKTINRKIATI